MPEAALIPQLVAGAQQREAQMVDKGKSLFDDKLEDRPIRWKRSTGRSMPAASVRSASSTTTR